METFNVWVKVLPYISSIIKDENLIQYNSGIEKGRQSTIHIF